MCGISKYKESIDNIHVSGLNCPSWDDLCDRQDHLSEIGSVSSMYGHLMPSVRVLYDRARYRVFDYRITLDYNIRIFNLMDEFCHVLDHVTLPFNVLEVKTIRTNPPVPLAGIYKLKQTSFSKFFMGIQLLQGMDP